LRSGLLFIGPPCMPRARAPQLISAVDRTVRLSGDRRYCVILCYYLCFVVC